MTAKQVVVVLGSQWGDEGKGKIVDTLAADFGLCVRFNGGSNAGHTIVVDGVKHAFNLLPSGILHPKCTSVLGNGTVIHLPTLFHELEQLDKASIVHQGRLKISDRAHLVLDFHQTVDGMHEQSLGDKKIGTTKKGIGPTYSSKMTRNGIRVCDLFNEVTFEAKLRKLVGSLKQAYGEFNYDVEADLKRYAAFREKLRSNVVDSVELLNNAYNAGTRILFEGANATMLDIDHGTYPYVTSSSTVVGGVCTGAGLSPQKIEEVIGVVKAYTTRVGAGPFPTELEDATGQGLRDRGHEYGTVTLRPRRCGWLDIVVLRYSHMLNGFSLLNLTKLDVLTGIPELKIGVAYVDPETGRRYETFPADLDVVDRVNVEYLSLPGWDEDLRKCKSYDSLPENAKMYVAKVEELVGVPIKWIGVGAGREDTITK